MPSVAREHCPVCDSTDSRVLLSVPCDMPAFAAAVLVKAEESRRKRILGHFSGQTFEYRECSHCQLVWQARVLDDAGVADLFADDAAPQFEIDEARLKAYLKTHRNQWGERLAAKVLGAFALTCKPAHDVRALDFGFGWGRWLEMARSTGASVVGVELSHPKLRFMRTRGFEVTERLEDVTGTFDVINCDQVLEHLPAPRQLASQLAQRLSPGGVIRLSVPNGKGCAHTLVEEGMACDAPAITPLEHLNAFTNRSLRELGRFMGLEPVLPPARYASRGAFALISAHVHARTRTTLHFRRNA